MRDRALGFRLLLASQSLSQAADGLGQATLASVLVLDALTEGAPGRILSLFVITLVPYSLIGPLAGVLVDRAPRRALLLGANILRALLLLTLLWWGHLFPGDGELFAGALVLLGLGRLYLTTKSAVLPMLVADEELLRGNALSNGFGMVAALVGGSAGVVLAGLVGITTSFVITAIVYLGSAALAAPISLEKRRDRGAESLGAAIVRVAGDMSAGIKIVWKDLRARLPLTTIFVARTLAMLIAIVAVLVIKTEFPDEGDRIGRLSAGALALGAAGVGAFVGTITAGFLGRRFTKPVLMLTGLALSGVGILLLGGFVDLTAIVALSFIAGYGAFITKVAVDAHIQEVLRSDVHGRAFSFYDIIYNMASVAAAGIVVALGGFSLRALVLLSGLAALGMAAGLAALMVRAGLLGPRARAVTQEGAAP